MLYNIPFITSFMLYFYTYNCHKDPSYIGVFSSDSSERFWSPFWSPEYIDWWWVCQHFWKAKGLGSPVFFYIIHIYIYIYLYIQYLSTYIIIYIIQMYTCIYIYIYYSRMCLKQQKTILQITIDRCYKPFPNGWFIIVLTTLPSIWKKIEFFWPRIQKYQWYSVIIFVMMVTTITSIVTRILYSAPKKGCRKMFPSMDWFKGKS